MKIRGVLGLLYMGGLETESMKELQQDSGTRERSGAAAAPASERSHSRT